MKLRVGLILATMVLGGMLLSGVVLAKTCSHNCRGTGGDDYLTGSGSGNTIAGLGGDDTVKGLGGADWLFGDPGGDKLSGGAGVDHIRGGTGLDKLDGKKGNDHLKDVERAPQRSTARSKQRTVDALIGSPKNLTVDVLIGGRGNDTFMARDGKKDIIRGGPGHDTAYVDRVDKVTGVEKEVVPGGGGAPGGPQPKKCEDGKDNDGDGKTDKQDPGCASAADNTESPDPPPKQCADGKDNDGDGKIDFGTQNPDPGCDSLTDNTENTPPVAKNDELTTEENNAEGVKVLVNDTDDDNDTLTVTNVTDPIHGTVPQDSWGPSDNIPTYTPDDCYDGGDSFKYTVSDGHGGTDKGTVNVTVAPDTSVCPP
jgi:hypothetical protein